MLSQKRKRSPKRDVDVEETNVKEDRMIDMIWLEKALETIRNGICDKLTKGNVTAYRVKNIIRIDIKED